MINENLGFEIFSNGLLRTFDGGKTWSQITTLKLSFGGFLNGVVIDFITPNTGWIAVGSLDEPYTIVLHTDDGGCNWDVTRLSNVSGIISLDFINEKHGWLFANTQGGSLGSSDVELYVTEDGGKNWSEISKTESNHQTPGSLPFAGHKSGISFIDSQNGWSTGGIGWSDAIWFYETNDEGQTWKPQNIPQPPKIKKLNAYPNTSPPKFFSNSEGIFSVTYHGEGDNQTKVAFYSTLDGGKSWNPSMPLTVSGPFASDFASLEDGWVIDGNGIQATIDSGKHWSKITPNIEFSGIDNLTLISPSVGFVTIFVPASDKSSKDTWKLYKTIDSGHNWVEVNLTS
ncbi:hypothetical protein [Desulfitobacterium sp.]|uniref:WD40/YVTN/BNR-like repeat-containing protein n=1 Tax=Desulfitobacterium sp. TaxID=49981 RepID=UPI002B6C2A15|nr:hypothetical protein [Desulfitobacterium sp.]HVJ49082.1 hypothetical protein [Desulfitobacterium sp.]